MRYTTEELLGMIIDPKPGQWPFASPATRNSGTLEAEMRRMVEGPAADGARGRATRAA